MLERDISTDKQCERQLLDLVWKFTSVISLVFINDRF